jgi:glycosyltransferase involved in cell wall biosynthesis
LIVSLNTYSSGFNDGKLKELGRRIEGVVAVAGDRATLWGDKNESRRGAGYEVRIMRTRFPRSNATTQLIALRRVVESVRPTVIHIECEPWQSVAIQSILLGRRLGVPVGIQFAENGPALRGLSGMVRTSLARWALRRCSYAVGWATGSGLIARRLAPGIRVEISPGTGVPTPGSTGPAPERSEKWFGGDAAGHAKVAFVGRFSPEKGLNDFLAIADSLQKRIPVRVAVAGGSPEDAQIAQWLSSRPWARVHGILVRPEVIELLAAADVLVAPSRTTGSVKEQFGKAPAEAMSLGTPVFAFDCGALREVIGDGGTVVPEGDVDALVNELERHFRMPSAARADRSCRARARAAAYSDSSLAEDLIRIWSDLTEPKNGSLNAGRA